MKNTVFSKSKIWLILNSFLCFVTAFIFVKGAIGFMRFITMRYFNAWVNLDNFDVLCLNGKQASIWNENSVLTMYSVGFFVGIFLVFSGYYLYKQFKSKKGILKLWIVWIYIISVNQSFGLFLRDIPLKRDTFHALNWIQVPYELLMGIIVASSIIIIIIHSFSPRKFLRLATSSREIKDNYSRRTLYSQIVVIPALLGSIFLLLLHFWDIRDYEIIELAILNLSICIPYITFISNNSPKRIRILKDENTNIRNNKIIAVFALFIAILFIVKIVYFY